MHIAETLHDDGVAVSAYDPVVKRLPGYVTIEEGSLEIAATLEGAVAGADAVALVTEWDEFAEIDWPAIKDIMRGNLVIDGRNALDPAVVRAAGFTYEGIGRPYP